MPMEILRNWAERPKIEQREREPVFIFYSLWWLHLQMCINNQNEEIIGWKTKTEKKQQRKSKKKKKRKKGVIDSLIPHTMYWIDSVVVKKLIKASAENINISNHSCIDDVKSLELS